ncbi:MAG TPA: xanthine dehydrogenase family protein subunit M [Armatimonadota bacterium]|nr:xanthine dehydrogenase family protein subunit M [Armatimonadota bacterium]
MPRPDMLQPATLDDALRALAKRGAVPLAGATDLIPAMLKGEAAPKILVNLKGISALDGIRRARGGVRIGALTRVADLLRDDLCAEHAPLLVDVAREFASPQIRSLATIGGNLCNAAPSADFALPLLVLDARVASAGPEGAREMPIEEFFRGVNKTALRRGEILTAIAIPKRRPRTGTAWAKLGVRRAMDLAFVGVAAAIQLAPNMEKCRSARIALGAVAPIPMRARKAEAVLEGKAITNELIEEAAAAAAAESRPITDLRASKEYRREMTEVLTRRAVREAIRQARKEQSK